MTVERPLGLNFVVNDERIERLKNEPALEALNSTQTRKDKKAIKKEIEEGEQLQQEILDMLKKMKSKKVYKDRKEFLKYLDEVIDSTGLDIDAPLYKAIVSALSEKDPEAEICRDSKGNPEPDADLRDTEMVPLPDKIKLPLPIDYDKKAKNDKLLVLVKDHCEGYLKKEVLPHVPDAWIDHSKTKVGYEIPLNRHFYVYEPPRELNEIEGEIEIVEKEILKMLSNLNK